MKKGKIMQLRYCYIGYQVINFPSNKERIGLLPHYITYQQRKCRWGLNLTWGLITANGILGIVENTSNHFATVTKAS